MTPFSLLHDHIINGSSFGIQQIVFSRRILFGTLNVFVHYDIKKQHRHSFLKLGLMEQLSCYCSEKCYSGHFHLKFT